MTKLSFEVSQSGPHHAYRTYGAPAARNTQHTIRMRHDGGIFKYTNLFRNDKHRTV